MTNRLFIIAACLSLVVACSDDEPAGGNAGNGGADTGAADTGSDTATDADQDTGTDDDTGADTEADASDTGDAQADSGDAGSACIQVEASLLFEAWSDSVSVEYSTDVTPAIDGQTRQLSLLFERYLNAEYTGTIELGGQGANGNFGTCIHCVYIRGDDRDRAWFADRGTLVLHEDPFTRQLDVEVSNLRLIQVDVGEGRTSTPVPDGSCIEVAPFSKDDIYPPQAWTCAKVSYMDGQFCNCECGADDPDCFVGESQCLPGDPSCGDTGGQEPLPVVGCEEAEICAPDPTTAGPVCTETCDWIGRDGCTTGTCLYNTGVTDHDLCITATERIAPDVGIGEPCPEVNNLQVYCNVVDGFVEGYCDTANVCKPICDADADCTVDGETCQFFTGSEGLGYCGTPGIDPDGE